MSPRKPTPYEQFGQHDKPRDPPKAKAPAPVLPSSARGPPDYPFDDELVPFERLSPDFGLHYRRKTLWTWCHDGRFPRPIQLSANRICWKARELRAWIASRPRWVRGPTAIERARAAAGHHKPKPKPKPRRGREAAQTAPAEDGA
jgi:hypothetical protein